VKTTAPETSRALFWAVIASTAGFFVAKSVVRLASGSSTGITMTDWRLVSIVGTEAVMALIWVPWLARRGWTMRCVTLPFTPRDTFPAIALAVAAYLAYLWSFMMVSTTIPELARVASRFRVTGSVSLWAVILLSVANPIAEEFLYLGFVANTLRREGMAFALSASIVTRVLVHLYQGPVAFITNVPIGGIFAFYYLRSGRIWPAVLAHGLFDLVALATLLR
jgi:membrane protease YdiL (CAAX protease family)